MMLDLGKNPHPRLRDLAVTAERYVSLSSNGHQRRPALEAERKALLKADLQDLQDKGKALLSDHKISGLAQLAAHYQDTEEHRKELARSAREVLGSMAVMIITFANRAGQETLEHGFLWWYLIRPFAAAGVGVLFYMAIIAGFFNQTSARGRSALVLAAAIGGLAGLFTDNVVQKMRALLGLSSFSESAANAKPDTNTQGSGS